MICKSCMICNMLKFKLKCIYYYIKNKVVPMLFKGSFNLWCLSQFHWSWKYCFSSFDVSCSNNKMYILYMWKKYMSFYYDFCTQYIVCFCWGILVSCSFFPIIYPSSPFFSILHTGMYFDFVICSHDWTMLRWKLWLMGSCVHFIFLKCPNYIKLW